MSSFNNVTLNVSMFNGTSEHAEFNFHCHYRSQYFRVFYIPLFHAIVMISGMVVNLCMIVKLRRALSKTSKRQKRTRRDMDFFFLHLGLCDIATLMTIPMWVTQAFFTNGWVFGSVVCKLVKGMITFCFQYGISLLVYINVERYMKIVHNRLPLKIFLVDGRGSRRRRVISRLCGCVPAFWALLDICYYTVLPVSEKGTMCFNGMHPHFQIIVFWLKMNMFFILPIFILVYCNGMIVYSVRRHVNQNSFGQKMKRAQVLPLLTASCFLLCWTPLLVSSIYYSSHKTCEEVKYVVFNLCVAIGNVHCITSPSLYIITRFRRRTCHSPQKTCYVVSENKKRFARSTSQDPEERERSVSKEDERSVNSTSQEQELRECLGSQKEERSVN